METGIWKLETELENGIQKLANGSRNLENGTWNLVAGRRTFSQSLATRAEICRQARGTLGPNIRSGPFGARGVLDFGACTVFHSHFSEVTLSLTLSALTLHAPL